MRRTKRLAAAALAATVLAGCQTRPPPVPENAPAEQRVDVTFYPQDAYQCGPAALAMALDFAGQKVKPKALVDEVWLPGRQGSLLLELRAAARARERLVYPVDSPQALFQQLDAGYPVLVMQNLAFSFWPRWHFAVVTGYTDNGERMILHTGTTESDRQHWNRFIRTWARAEYRGLVIPPPGRLPGKADPVKLVGALEDLRNTAGTKAAVPYWQTAMERWPEQYLIQFGWGNLQWNRNQPGEAIRAFRKAVAIDPEAASAWNNLAESWRQSGCPARAQKAIQKALALEPDRSAFRDTRERIDDMTESSCPPELTTLSDSTQPGP